MNLKSDSRQTLLEYIGALAARDLDAVERLMCAHSLVEIPFLKPDRLVGLREISEAHGDMFSNLERIEFSAEHILCDASHAIAEGRLCVQRGAQTSEYAAGLTIELQDDRLQRVSLYADARNSRLWSDRSIL